MLISSFLRALCIGASVLTASGRGQGSGQVQNRVDRCWTCDQSPGCFECLSKIDNGDGTSTVELDFSECKNDDISWACCIESSGPGYESGECDVPISGCFGKDNEPNNPDGENPKCIDVSVMFVVVPFDATSVLINTHDGRAGNDASPPVGADPICSGQEFQGSQCATSDNSVTAHCLETIDLSSCPSAPSASPSAAPSASPSAAPSASPSAAPSASPSASPSAAPSASPSASPSAAPSASPSASPSAAPSASPSAAPSASPSAAPSASPSEAPSAAPSASPSAAPSASPSASPSAAPSASPSAAPSASPSEAPSAAPSASPSEAPSSSPSEAPSAAPSSSPSEAPSAAPSASPSAAPSASPSEAPSAAPSASPSAAPTGECFNREGEVCREPVDACDVRELCVEGDESCPTCDNKFTGGFALKCGNNAFLCGPPDLDSFGCNIGQNRNTIVVRLAYPECINNGTIELQASCASFNDGTATGGLGLSGWATGVCTDVGGSQFWECNEATDKGTTSGSTVFPVILEVETNPDQCEDASDF